MAVNSSSWFSMNYRMSSKANGILICFIVLLTEGVFGNHFINHFAVHIPGGPVVATKIAQENGYLVKGQIGSLENHFLFEHPHVHKRSARRNEEHHETLSGHPEVHWFEQQRLVSRKKRDFLPIPADIASDLESESRTQLESKSRSRRDVKNQEIHFNDQLYSHMWYFNGGGLNHTDMNVIGAWKRGVTGKDVVITILDDGLERTHDDIKDNYDPYASYDVNGHKADPMPRYDYTNENRHGTRCAGEVSAKANNTKCIVGVAYNSKIGGVRMLDGDVYDAVEATSLSHNRSHIDIYSASWGPDDDGRVVDGPGILAKKAFVDGVRLGRNGKGSIFVWASGNGGNQRDSCNCDGYTNSVYTLSISSISQRGKKPWYLEECSSTLATTYSSGAYGESQIVTVDLHNKCTETHTGTSASAPLAAGIVALSLEVNPTLTWRDVQYITLMTARPLPDGEWVTNGVGRQVSLRYGYGLMDATAMVELAEKWTNVPEQHLCEVKSQKAGTPGKPVRIPDSGYSEILDTNACAGTPNAINFLEHVQAKFTIKSKRRGDLVIKLISPMGTKSTILPQRPNDSDRLKGFNGWAFLSVHFWGENPVGKWKLEVEVRQNNHGYIGSSYSGTQMTNDLVEWSLILYGVEENPVNLISPTQAPPPSVQTTNSGSCHSLCLGGCTGPQSNQCNDCKTYKIEATGKCVQSCPNNFYADEFSCKPCDSTCETCTYISSKEIMCLKCKPGFLLVEGKGTCVQVCEKGYYKGEVGTTTVLPVQERSDIACLKDYIDVFLPVDILPAGRNLTWRDEDCRVDFNGTHYTDKLPFSECGTTIKMENDTVTFMNDLIVRINRNTDAAIYELYEYRDDDVTYGDDYETIIPVQCVYPRTGSVSTSYAPIRQNIRFFEKRYGQLDVKMEQFVSADYSEIVPSGEYPRKISLDDDVFIRVALGFERGDLQLRADNCIATATPSPSDAKWRQLIEKGCPENRVRLLSVKESRDVKFTFKAFDFRHDSTGFVYVHCEVAVCSPSDNACAMGCDARAKRALAPEWISGSHLVSTGPLLISRPAEDSKSESFTMPILIAGTSMLVAAIAVVLAIVGWTRKPSLQNDVRLT